MGAFLDFLLMCWHMVVCDVHVHSVCAQEVKNLVKGA